LLSALAALGIVATSVSGYRLTEMGQCLSRTAPGSLRDWTLFECEVLTSSWSGLTESIRTGKTASELDSQVGGRFGAIGRDPRLGELFDNAMVSMARHVAKDVLAAHDFSRAGSILDVGGGTGALLIDILRALPGLTGAVLDLPRCENGFRQVAAGLEQRARFIAGDFLQGIPQGFDTLLVKSVLHNWDDSRCVGILGHCRKALSPGGRIVIVERLLPEHPAKAARDMSIVLSDLNMLRGPGGRERTEPAYRKLLAAAGFSVSSIAPAGRYDVLVAL
jgi:SAM-dependent methyltransferase